MKYSKRKDRYCCNVLNDNFHEIDSRLNDLEENGGGSGGGGSTDIDYSKIEFDTEEIVVETEATTLNILDSLTEIEANTESGKIAGALAVKELADSLSELVHLGTITNPTLGQVETAITLSDDINNYKSLYILYSIANDIRYTKIPISLLKNSGNFNVCVELNQLGSYMYARIYVQNNIAKTMDVRTNYEGWQNYFNINIYGVKTL